MNFYHVKLFSSFIQSTHSDAVRIGHCMGNQYKQWTSRSWSSELAQCSTGDSEALGAWLRFAGYDSSAFPNVSMGICWQPARLLFVGHCERSRS